MCCSMSGHIQTDTAGLSLHCMLGSRSISYVCVATCSLNDSMIQQSVILCSSAEWMGEHWQISAISAAEAAWAAIERQRQQPDWRPPTLLFVQLSAKQIKLPGPPAWQEQRRQVAQQQNLERSLSDNGEEAAPAAVCFNDNCVRLGLALYQLAAVHVAAPGHHRYYVSMAAAPQAAPAWYAYEVCIRDGGAVKLMPAGGVQSLPLSERYMVSALGFIRSDI